MLADELDKISNEVAITSPELFQAYEEVILDMKSFAKGGRRSCPMHSYNLPTEPLKALKLKLQQEGIELVEHQNQKGRDWTELKW